MVYRDQQHKIQTTNRPTNILTCTIKSSLISLNSTPYSQALRINTIRSTTSEFNKNNEIIIKRPKERRYPKNLVIEQVDNVNNIKSKQLLLTNNEKRIQLHSSLHNLQYISAKYIKNYHKKLEHFANTNDSSKSI